MKITVYSTKTCGYCHMLKDWLDKKDVEYTEYKVDENPYAAQMMVSKSGQMGVPFSVIETDDGKEVGILGFDRPRFEQVLAGK